MSARPQTPLLPSSKYGFLPSIGYHNTSLFPHTHHERPAASSLEEDGRDVQQGPGVQQVMQAVLRRQLSTKLVQARRTASRDGPTPVAL